MARHHLVLSRPCCFRHASHCLIVVIALWGRGNCHFQRLCLHMRCKPKFAHCFCSRCCRLQLAAQHRQLPILPRSRHLLTIQEASLPPYPSPLQPTWAAQTDAEGGFRRLSANWPDSIHFACFDSGAIQASQSTTVNCKTITCLSMFVPDGPGHVQRGYSDLRVQIHTQAGQPIGQCNQMTLFVCCPVFTTCNPLRPCIHHACNLPVSHWGPQDLVSWPFGKRDVGMVLSFSHCSCRHRRA